MTDPDTSQHVEIKDGDQTVAAAEVTTSQDAGGTVQASLHAASGHIAPGSRASLVDAVMDLPEVQKQFANEGAEVVRMTSAEFGTFMFDVSPRSTMPVNATLNWSWFATIRIGSDA